MIGNVRASLLVAFFALAPSLAFATSIEAGDHGRFNGHVPDQLTMAAVPEPATMILLGAGLLVAFRKRRVLTQ